MKKNKYSFTQSVKDELANMDLGSNNESIAELHAFLSVNGNLVLKDGGRYLETVTEHEYTAKRIYAIFKDLFGDDFPIDVQVSKSKTKKQKTRYRISVNESYKSMEQLGINLAGDKKFMEKILKDEEAFQAFFRGLFLAGGSVNDPNTIFYHLEITLQSLEHANFVLDVVNSFQYFKFKVTQRRNRFIVYAKKAEMIRDFLNLIGSQSAALHFQGVWAERDLFNTINRDANFEMANLEKTATAATETIKMLKELKKINDLNFLTQKEQDIANIRINFPEMNYSQIASHYTKTYNEDLTKSGVNHTIRRIKENYKNYKKDK